MDQTPAHDNANLTVLEIIPAQSKRIIEIGCGSGALAREFKNVNLECHYIGLDIVDHYAGIAVRYCDETIEQQHTQEYDSFYI